MDPLPAPVPPRGPWLEYMLGAGAYAALAYWLYTLNRPGLLVLCALLGILSVWGAIYLLKR